MVKTYKTIYEIRAQNPIYSSIIDKHYRRITLNTLILCSSLTHAKRMLKQLTKEYSGCDNKLTLYKVDNSPFSLKVVSVCYNKVYFENENGLFYQEHCGMLNSILKKCDIPSFDKNLFLPIKFVWQHNNMHGFQDFGTLKICDEPST